MRCDLVIFDCDGVLIDSELLSVKADLACFAEAGIAITAEEIRDRYIGIAQAEMEADVASRYGRKLPLDFSARHRQRLQQIFEAELRAMPGIAAALAALTCRTCVASGSSPDRLHHALSLVGLYDRFHPHIFSASLVARGKPAPDLFLYAASRMEAPAPHCVVVEDSVAGVTAAVAAGMTAIGFTGGSHCRPGHDSRLAAAGAGIVIDDLSRLLPALAALAV